MSEALSAPVNPLATKLSREFVDWATSRIKSISKIQEGFIAVNTADARCTQALMGVRLVARYRVGVIVQELQAWRQQTMDDIAKMHSANTDRDRLLGFYKRGAVEAFFMEAAVQLLEEYTQTFSHDPRFTNFVVETQKITFNWLVCNDEYLPADMRSHLLSSCSRLLGAMARIKLDYISLIYFNHIQERINPKKETKPNYDALRGQILRLCSGMSSVTLTFEDDEQLRAATEFLKLSDPLLYTSPVRKSQIHHALADTLTQVLWPLVRADEPHCMAAQLSPEMMLKWYNLVLQAKNSLWAWSNKHVKHIQDGYPLVVTLVCLLDDKSYSSAVDDMKEYFLKQLKNKEMRVLSAKCLGLLAVSYLTRYGKAMPPHELTKWLLKVYSPLLAVAKKGGLNANEQLDLIAPIVELSPEFAMQHLILDLLQSEIPDCVSVALRALHTVIFRAATIPAPSPAPSSAPGGASPTGAGGGGGGVGGGTPIPSIASSSSLSSIAGSLSGGSSVQSGSVGRYDELASTMKKNAPARLAPPEIVQLIRNGHHPFDLLGISHLQQGINAALGKLVNSWHPLYGVSAVYSSPDVYLKDRSQGISLYCWLIRIMPYMRPHKWWGGSHTKALELLSMYTAHPEPQMRICASDALEAVVLTTPDMRNAAIVTYANHLATLTDDSMMVLREGIPFMRRLMSSWCEILAHRRDYCIQEYSKMEALSMDVHRLEGFGLAMLCSPDETVRREALRLLSQVRTLHVAVCEAEPYESPMPFLATSMTTLPSKDLSTGIVRRDSSPYPSPRGPASTLLPPSTSAGHHRGGTAPPDSLDLHPGTSTSSLPNFKSRSVVSDCNADSSMIYVIEVIEQSGADIVHNCYWDFGEWSDLWQQYRTCPELGTASLEVVLNSGHDDASRQRLVRCLLELCKLVGRMNVQSAIYTQAELTTRLARSLGRDSQGRMMHPQDQFEGRRTETWRNASCVAVCCAHSMPFSLTPNDTSRRNPGGMAQKKNGEELVKSHVALLISAAGSGAVPPVTLQLSSIMALGHVNPEHYDVLMTEISPVIDEYSRGPAKQRSAISNFLGASLDAGQKTGRRPEDLRRLVAHVYRTLAFNLSSTSLAQYPQIRARFMEWIKDTYLHLRTLSFSSDAFWDNSQVAYCLASVVRSVARFMPRQLSQTLGEIRDLQSIGQGSSGRSAPPMNSQATSAEQLRSLAPQPLRKLLFDLFSTWSEEGYPSNADYTKHVKAGIQAFLSRFSREKDAEGQIESTRSELSQASVCLDHASRLSMAELLKGPLFDPNPKRCLAWTNRLLISGETRAGGPTKLSVGQTALLNLLRSNVPELFATCVNHCYASDKNVAHGYFQAVSEVYATQTVGIELHVLISLILHKMVDATMEVREDALHMLHTLSKREWRQKQPGAGEPSSASAEPPSPAECDGDEESVVVLGNLQDAYQQFQFQLSSKLAREHPEMSEALCEEVMARQLECADALTQHPVLICMAPWMANISISPHWKGVWCERLLKGLYYVTLNHGSKFPFEIERLWSTLADNKRNIIPILDFLISLGMHCALQEVAKIVEHFSVSKRIALFMARISPQQTMDHLVYEISMQVHECDRAGGAMCATMSKSSSGGGSHPNPLRHYHQYYHQSGGGGRASGSAGHDHPIEFASEAIDAMRIAYLEEVDSGEVFGDNGDDGIESQYFEKTSATTGLMNTSLMSDEFVSGDLGSMSGLNKSGRSEPDNVQARISNQAPLSVADSAMTSSVRVGGDSTTSQNSTPRLEKSTSERQHYSSQTSNVSPTKLPANNPGQIPLLTRPELALCLLTEVAYEHDEDFRTHLALLFHCCVINLDNHEGLVSGHGQQLLVNLLYSLSARHVEAQQQNTYDEDGTNEGTDCTQVLELVRYLLSMRGRRLWLHEDCGLRRSEVPSAAALASLVDAVTSSMVFEGSLRVQWAEVSLDWALHCRSRHLCCRSWQVFRSLRPSMSADVAATLLMCMHQCSVAQGVQASDVTVELINTLKALIHNMAPGRLVVYPQTFWAALALLHTRYVHLYGQALGLLEAVLVHLDLHRPKVQSVLLACAPGMQGLVLLMHSVALLGGTDKEVAPVDEPETWAVGLQILGLPQDTPRPRFHSVAIQQLLLKGLAFDDTQCASLKAIEQLATTLAHQGASMYERTARATASDFKLKQEEQMLQRQQQQQAATQDPASQGLTHTSAASTNSKQYNESFRKHCALKLDGFKALLGPWKSQLFVSIMGVLPLHLAHVLNLSSMGETTSTPPVANQRVSTARYTPRSPLITSALTSCLTSLASAATAYGLEGLCSQLLSLAYFGQQPPSKTSALTPSHLDPTSLTTSLPPLVTALCDEVAASFFPHYSSWFLHHCIDVLSSKAAPKAHLWGTLLMLRCMFEVQGELPLSVGAVQFISDPGAMAPLAAMVQGCYSSQAFNTISAIISFSQRRGLRVGLPTDSTGGTLPRLPTPPSPINSKAKPEFVFRTLTPPPVSVSGSLRKVIDTLGSSVQRGRRSAKMMPFLSPAAGGPPKA